MRYLLDTLTFKSNQNELTTHQRFKSYLNAALGMQHEAKFEYEVQYNWNTLHVFEAQSIDHHVEYKCKHIFNSSIFYT